MANSRPCRGHSCPSALSTRCSGGLIPSLPSGSSPVTREWPDSPPPGLTAVIFDLGGTLIDYLGDADSWPSMELPGVRALHGCLAAAGFPGEADAFCDAFVRSIEGSWLAAIDGGDPPTLGALVAEACTAARFSLGDELHETAVAAYCAPIAERAAMSHGAADVLEWLRARDVRLGLVSNTVWPAEAHRRDLQRYGLLGYFHVTLFSSETGLWKPDRRVFQRALEELGAGSDETVYVGDQLAEDVGGGLRAGLRTVLFGDLPQNVGGPAAERYVPHGQIRSLAELPGVLARMYGR